jgi:N-acetylneuraminic acid mutarotase
MIVWGGLNVLALNTGGRYNPITNSWTATDTTGAPAARSHHTSIWTGTEMIVWGGLNGLALNTGGRYIP